MGVVTVSAEHRITGAIDGEQHSLTAAISIPIEIGIEQDFCFVDASIAVIIHTIGELIRFGGDAGVCIITVEVVEAGLSGLCTSLEWLGLAVTISIVVEIEIEQMCDRFIDRAVAVVVKAITYFECVEVNRGIGIIAVLEVTAVSVGNSAGLSGASASRAAAITVEIRIGPGLLHDLFVDAAVAVIVTSVAALCCVGMDIVAGIVTVMCVECVPLRLHTREGRLLGIAERIAIKVGIEGLAGGKIFVELTITVIIDAVTPLGGIGIHLGVVIVAVPAEHSDAILVPIRCHGYGERTELQTFPEGALSGHILYLEVGGLQLIELSRCTSIELEGVEASTFDIDTEEAILIGGGGAAAGIIFTTGFDGEVGERLASGIDGFAGDAVFIFEGHVCIPP